MKLLDLFCGEGLAAWGYWKSARFSEIVGVDIADMKHRYAFDFIQRDALTLDYDFLMDFDFIHASPPCQAYSKITPDQSKHPRLIARTHLMLAAAGKRYVIENVEGSGAELKPTLRLYGRDVGLNMDRPRYFHISDFFINAVPGDHFNLSTGSHINAIPGDQINSVVADYLNPSGAVHVHGGQYVNRDRLIEAFGLDMIPLARRRLLTREGIEQGIPPAFTKLISEMLFAQKFMVA